MDGTIEYPLIKPDELAGEAWAAAGRQDPEAALLLWQALREHSPERPDGYIWPIHVLWQHGRFAEAEAMAAQAFARFANHPELVVQHAWIAAAQQRWDEAARRWSQVRAHAPERLEGYLWGGRALWLSGRLAEAEALTDEALRRYPSSEEALAQRAWIAMSRQDWDEALRRWTRVREAFPERLDAAVGTVQALRLAGRIDDAEAMLSGALARHPDDTELLIEHVWAAVVRQDWPTAAARLETARGTGRDLARIEESLSPVEYQIRSLSAAEGNAVPRPPDATVPQDEVTDTAELDNAPDALMLAFESLGERCDFGAVQRHFGLEPLGLLRFAYSQFEPLLAALEDRFDAVGTVEDTSFELYQDETIVRMKKYGLVFHTFVYRVAEETAGKREAFYQQQRRRLLFLKNKLIADLEEPQKIFVYATDAYASDAHAARLFAVLRAYGPNVLFHVRPAHGDRPAGMVEVLEDGLYAGYFPGLTDFTAGNQPPFELWRRLCARVYQLAQAGAGSAFLKSPTGDG